MTEANPALAVDANYKNLSTANDDAIYAYLRSKGNSKVLVILDLSGAQQQFQLLDAAAAGTYNNVFRTAKETITNGAAMQLQPWEYFVCEVR